MSRGVDTWRAALVTALLSMLGPGCGARSGLPVDEGEGATGGDPCVGGQCLSPPPPTCVSTTTLRSFGESGTCSAGTCSYESTDSACPEGCSGGVCSSVIRPGVIAVGSGYSCTVVGGAARCWGDNTWGTLGNATTGNSAVAVQVTGLSAEVAAISAGDTHACALTTSGRVLCWGQGFFGELGNGSQTDTPMPIPVGVVGLPSGILAVAAGGQHTCALTAERIVLCWGKNGFGELGNGTMVDSLAPVAVLGLSPGVLALSAGASNTCAIMASGALRCWGLNYAGVIGNDANSKSAVAVDNTGLSSGIIEVSVGELHACALRAGGKVLCWGLNGTGQLGSPLVSESAQPLEVAGLPGDVAGVAAGFAQSCAFTAGGELRFWGDGSFLPTTVNGLSSGVVAVAAGNNAHQCVAMSNGVVKCWGQNQSGQLGDGSTTASAVPVDVKGL